MKVRIIPTILTDGLTVVKGENFDNWRTVGSAEATARLYASRDVDELLFLDVNARSRHTMIDKNLLAHFSDVLDIPFSVGGGINNLEDAKICFRQGAEKIVLGTVALENPHIISEIADVFGNQAIIVSIDFANDESVRVLTNSGKAEIEIEIFEFIDKLEALGAGEILLQSKVRDGTLVGMDLKRISQISNITNLPIIAGSGAGSAEDCYAAIINGAAAVSVGALFQFTEITPNKIKMHLTENGIPTRDVGV